MENMVMKKEIDLRAPLSTKHVSAFKLNEGSF